MNTRQCLSLLATLALFIFLAACQTSGMPGGDNDPNDPGGPGEGGVSQLGFVMVEESEADDEVTAVGAFAEYGFELPSDFLENPFATELDSCDIFSSDDTPPIDIPAPGDDPDIEITTLDAGTELTLGTGGATYATLPKRAFSSGGETFIIYGASEGYPRPIPEGLTVDIPGTSGGFPGFSNVAFGSVVSFELSAPEASAQITPETTFSWEASGSDDTTVNIEASAFDFSTGEFISVSCTARDDGSFSFPAATQTEMGANFQSTFFSASRSSYRIEQKGKAALILSVKSE